MNQINGRREGSEGSSPVQEDGEPRPEGRAEVVLGPTGRLEKVIGILFRESERRMELERRPADRRDGRRERTRESSDPGTPTNPPGPPVPGIGSGAGTFVWEGAGGTGGVHGGSVVLGGFAGEIAGPIGCWSGYCWRSCSAGDGWPGCGAGGGGCVFGSCVEVAPAAAGRTRTEPRVGSGPTPRSRRYRQPSRARAQTRERYEPATIARRAPRPPQPLEESLWNKDDVVRL